MYNNQDISSLSHTELRKALQKFQLKCGPITHTTRRLFENRLKAHLEKLNAEVESKEDKENWIVIDNKCYHGYNGKHENVKSEENNVDGIINSSNYDNPIVNAKKTCEQNYIPELPLGKNESSNSSEQVFNGDIERRIHWDNAVETVVNIGSFKTNDSNHIEVKISDVTYAWDDSKTLNSNFAGSQKLILHSGDIVNHNEACLHNVYLSDVSHTCVLDNVKNNEENFTHNAILQNNVQESGIDVTHDAVVVNGIKTSEASVTHDTNGLKYNGVGTCDSTNKTCGVAPSSLHAPSVEISSSDIQSPIATEAKPSEYESETNSAQGVYPSTKEIHRTSPCYYAVWIPHSSTRVNGNKPIICESQQEALLKMKGFKGSRFKMFESKAEAENFSLSKTMISTEKPIPLLVPAPSASEPKEKILKVPTFHEIIKFRQHIEKFKIDEIESCLANPRYLISASDIPVILQEGSRMNAVHIATKCNRVKVLKILFNHLQSDEFLRMVYSSMLDSHIDFRRNHLLDLYLNTPEKILCDTPLHLACKFGFTNVVKYLLTFKQLKVGAQNTDRRTSVEVICDRLYARSAADREKIRSEILSLFEEKAYVPLYDDELGTQPKIGRPILTISPDDIYKSQKVKAYAGPMSPDQACNVFEKWRKSPRDRTYCMIARSDYEKGMERIGRSIASSENVPFTEYWSFLDKFTNLTTTQGLKKLEKYLKSKYTASIQNCKRENCASATTTKKYNKIKSNRRIIETSFENGKLPGNIKRKLSFDEAKPNGRNKSKPEVNKCTGDVSKNNQSSPNNPIDLITDTSQGVPVSDQCGNSLDVKCPPDVNKKLVFNEKVSAVTGMGTWCVDVEKVAVEVLETHNVENKLKVTLNGPLKGKIFFDDALGDNLRNCSLKHTEYNSSLNCYYLDNQGRSNEENTTGDEDNEKNTSLRCSPWECLCDDSISEECYLSEAFNQLDIDSEVYVKLCALHLSDDCNVDMDLVNQSVSFHLESGKVPETCQSESSISDNSLCENLKKLEIDSATKISSTSSDDSTNSCHKIENLSHLSVGKPVPSSASFISPVPSLSVFDSSKLPSSSFNCLSPSLSSFENKVAIPGIINLPVNIDNSTKQNCYPEQHSLFIDGDQPSKHDLDVLRALGDSVEIDNYPHIRWWKCLVESFSDDAKSSWPSPGSPRYLKSSRRTLWSA